MERIGEPRWRTSSYSGNGGASCVEVASAGGAILVRDTKNHGRGPVHRYAPKAWHTFVAAVRNGQFDPSQPGRLP